MDPVIQGWFGAVIVTTTCSPSTNAPGYVQSLLEGAQKLTSNTTQLFFEGSTTLRCFALALCSRYSGARSALTPSRSGVPA